MPEDRLDALAWQAEQDAKCPGCGQPVDESFDPSIDGPGATNPFDAEALRCHACRIKAAVESQFTGEGGDAAGLYVVVRKNGSGGRDGQDLQSQLPGQRPGRAGPSLSGRSRTPDG